MNAQYVVTSVILDTRRQLQTGNYPIKLRLTYQRKQKYYPLALDLSKSDFDKVKDEKQRAGKFKTYRDQFIEVEDKARKIINKLTDFSFESFEKKFLNLSTGDNVFNYFKKSQERLTKEGRAGTADTYKCAYNSLMEFTGKKELSFKNVNPEFLREYERWMVAERISQKGKTIKGKSLTTVGIYLRNLRAIFNDAIHGETIKPEYYPFGKRGYEIPIGRNIKKALVMSDIEKIFKYTPITEAEGKARDLFIFSYLCNGINTKDIARLKYKHISGDKLTFFRAKTEKTSRANLKAIQVILTPEIDQIIKRWGTPSIHDEQYIFHILTGTESPEQELAKVKQATKTINKYIKRIGEKLKIDKNISTYTARHSYATVLKRAGVSIEFISESLGHKDLKTTQSYLDSFEDDVKKENSKLLIKF